ncbi:MAG: homoserine kinase [Acidobacteria bacterium]|nr:homoserine kinase [Acidobacteriota bacterium]
MTAFRITVPASSGNLGSGFDCLSLALGLYLQVEVERGAVSEARMEFHGEGEGTFLSGDNLMLRAMRHAAVRHGVALPPFRMKIWNDIPFSRGLGSSSAAILAGILAADWLSGLSLSEGEVLSLACGLEGHPDNVASALAGDLVVSAVEGETVYWAKVELSAAVRAVVVVPDFELDTHVARSVLPALVSREDAVFNLQRAALLVASAAKNELSWLGFTMKDRLHQPYRARLIPGLDSILALPLGDGLLGVALSGAGPSVLALATDRHQEIGQRIQQLFAEHGVRSQPRLLDIDRQGIRRHEPG